MLGILRTLVWQLLDRKPNQIHFLKDVYDVGLPLDVIGAQKALWHLLAKGDLCRLVLDGLDECATGVRIEILQLCQTLQLKAKIFVVSRFETDIGRAISKMAGRVAEFAVSREDNSGDIRAYLTKKVKQLEFSDVELVGRIVQQLSIGASGMFMCFWLMIEELTQQPNAAQVEEVLENLPSSLDAVYGRVLNRIDQSKHNRDLVYRMLQWITCALRPVFVAELDFALATESNSLAFNPKRRMMKPKAQIAEYGGSLNEIYNSTGQVRVAHASVQNFLTSSRFETRSYSSMLLRPEAAHCELARYCLAYLSYRNIKYASVNDNLETSIANLDQRMRNDCFFEYAAVH